MAMLKSIVFSVCLLAAISAASGTLAASKRVTGAALGQLLYGQHQTVRTPDGATFKVRYDKSGRMYVSGKRTGAVVRATKTGWCSYIGRKLNNCVGIWVDGRVYTAKATNGAVAFAFTIP